MNKHLFYITETLPHTKFYIYILPLYFCNNISTKLRYDSQNISGKTLKKRKYTIEISCFIKTTAFTTYSQNSLKCVFKVPEKKRETGKEDHF